MKIIKSKSLCLAASLAFLIVTLNGLMILRDIPISWIGPNAAWVLAGVFYIPSCALWYIATATPFGLARFWPKPQIKKYLFLALAAFVALLASKLIVPPMPDIWRWRSLLLKP